MGIGGDVNVLRLAPRIHYGTEVRCADGAIAMQLQLIASGELSLFS